MRLLLDTHTFIWWDSDPGKLSLRALELCQDRMNSILLSVVSIWEMQIKSQLGKLNFSLPLAELVKSQLEMNNLEILPIQLEHVLALEGLPTPHKDPFDRLLIAQASIEDAIIVSSDSQFGQYPVKVIW
jgi:PIN domain nuclease of toxin-antitoxin system